MARRASQDPTTDEIHYRALNYDGRLDPLCGIYSHCPGLKEKTEGTPVRESFFRWTYLCVTGCEGGSELTHW